MQAGFPVSSEEERSLPVQLMALTDHHNRTVSIWLFGCQRVQDSPKTRYGWIEGISSVPDTRVSTGSCRLKPSIGSPQSLCVAVRWKHGEDFGKEAASASALKACVILVSSLSAAHGLLLL